MTLSLSLSLSAAVGALLPDVCRFDCRSRSRSGLFPLPLPFPFPLEIPSSECADEKSRKFKIIKKVRFWRYVRKSSFFVERREKDAGGGCTADGAGREDSEDVRELVRVDSKSGVEGFVLDIFADAAVEGREMVERPGRETDDLD